MKRLDQLTFTRFLAVALVLIYHGGGGVYIKAFDKFPISSILYAAPTAVSFLYVLSGFVMSLVYYRPKEQFDVRGYWIARFVRIYPLYIISFLLVCLYYFDFMGRIKAPKILANIFVLQAWYPPYAQSFNYASWSMTVEFFFYFLFPFFTMWAYRQPTRRLIALSLVLWVVSQTAHNFLWMRYFPQWETFVVNNPIFHLNSFILGAVGGIWFLREGQTHEIKPIVNYIILAGSLLFFSLFMIAGDMYPDVVPHTLQPMQGMLSPIFVLTIVTLALDKTRLSVALNHPWLVMLGETAYALYILHVPVLWFSKRFLESAGLKNPQAAFDVIYLPLMISIGLISHLYIDRPLRRWLRDVMTRVSIPLLLLDLVAAAASIYLSFQFRFSSGKELLEFRSAAYAMFWCAFVIRIAVPLIFNATNPSILKLPFPQLARTVLLSVTTGSALLGGLMLSFASLGWLEGFPRSVLVIDWVLMIVFSTLIRLALKNIKPYRVIPEPA